MTETINQFTKSVTKSLLLHFCAIIGFILSLLSVLIGYWYAQDALLAVSIVLLLPLILGYYFIYTYTREHLTQKALLTRRNILKEFSSVLCDPTAQAERFLTLAHSIQYLPPKLSSFKYINRIFGWNLWKYFFFLKELFFLEAIEEYVTQIKLSPTTLHTHASLANCYVMLSQHYQEPLRKNSQLPWPSISLSPDIQEALSHKAKICASSAIEELSILKSFAPDELWVHDQLAISYRELAMPECETTEYEAIIQLSPNDYNALLRLGILYFIQGKTSKGLEIYEKLNIVQPVLAETLLHHYGAYTSILTPSQL